MEAADSLTDVPGEYGSSIIWEEEDDGRVGLVTRVSLLKAINMVGSTQAAEEID
jgi:hypothetical protein